MLSAARAGAEWAWRALYRDLAPVLLGYLRAKGAADSVEDVCGEVFCQVVRDIHTFDGDEAGFRSWVFVIAHHRLLDEQRRRSRRPEIPYEHAALANVKGTADTEAQALGRVACSEIGGLLDDLTPPQRDVVLLRVLVGLRTEEVARVIGKNPRAVKSLQHRAFEILRRRLRSESFPGPSALTKST